MGEEKSASRGMGEFSALLSQYRNWVSQSMLRLDRTFTE